ncbi:MAG: flagellar basal body L-ring protein FlgH [Gammaproteobacteria bacterium]|nr:MAG: flagellar basal body L-ring protein FlgH [Gammaproteobacteria bacterium]
MRNLIVAIAVFMLTACAEMMPILQDDPEFAPVEPITDYAEEEVPQYGSLFTQSSASFLYSDRKAARVGDLITINLNEKTNASKNADTEIKKEDENELRDPMISGRIPSYNGNPITYDINTNRLFKAEADSDQANSLNGTITVTVSKVLPNGNLMIKGEKWLTLNQGKEFIRIAGIIRPEDVSTDNTISSTKVADARISYSGTGLLDESNHMGWLSRFFNSGFFPF